MLARAVVPQFRCCCKKIERFATHYQELWTVHDGQLPGIPSVEIYCNLSVINTHTNGNSSTSLFPAIVRGPSVCISFEVLKILARDTDRTQYSVPDKYVSQSLDEFSSSDQ